MLKRILFFLPVILLSACLEESSEKLDKKEFTKIYDNQEFHSSFYAIDMKQTADGGYLIMGGKTKLVKENGEPENVNTPWAVYLLKVDKLGNLVKEITLMEDYVYPVGGLNAVGDSFYFFCMDIATNTYLVTVDQLLEVPNVKPVTYISGGEEFPITLALASAVDNGGTELLLLSYTNDSQESVVSRITPPNTATEDPVQASASAKFYTGAGSPIDGFVLSHVNHQGRQFPFAVGETSTGTYFFNGFIDYTFALVFTNLSDNEDVVTRINGHQENAGFSSLLPLSGQTFAVSSFSFGFNFLQPQVTFTGDANITAIQADAYSFPELENNARVKAIRGVVDDQNVIIYASNTKSGQVGLYIYDELSGEFLGSKYLGYSNPFEIASIVQTPEGDLAVSGTTYIAGRLPRFFLIKVPKKEIMD